MLTKSEGPIQAALRSSVKDKKVLGPFCPTDIEEILQIDLVHSSIGSFRA